jgi:hypothetical protein
MKKIAVFVVALVAMFAISSVVATAANKTVVKSTISIKFKGGSGPYFEQAKFSGKVKAQTNSNNLKKKCVTKRKVKVVNNDNGDVVGKAVTDSKGNYETGVDASFVGGDKYIAKVKKKTFKKGNTKVVCKKATSKAITAG